MKFKKIALFLLPVLLYNLSLSDISIEKNKSRINQIDKQLSENKTKIKNNNNKIYNAKKSEAQIKKSIRYLDNKIAALQKEYNYLEKKYIELQKKIGKNEEQIRQSIKNIEASNSKIDYSENQFNERLKALDRIRRANIIRNDDGIETVVQTKRRLDAKKILDLQTVNINSIKYYKKTVENNKKTVEKIKEKNINEVSNVKKARLDLENKRDELRSAKKEKDAQVSQLKKLQQALGYENKKIETATAKLIREKNELQRQISAIISKQNSNNKTSENSIPIVKGTGRLSMPIKGTIVLAFGQEKVKGLKSNGIEIRGSLGQSVMAADTGTVIHAGRLGSLGGIVIIDHAGIITVYGNLSTVRVNKKDNVKKGQVIGTLGRDSATKETNLYFETRKGVNLVDPLKYF